MYKEYFDKKRLITFDLDGTTVRSEPAWDTAFRSVCKVVGLDPLDTGPTGTTLEERWKAILAASKPETVRPLAELVELTKNEYVKSLDKLEVTEGFWPFVYELKTEKKLKLALATNTDRVITDRVIAALELKPVFDFVICGDEVKSPKPSPEIYKKVLAHFGISAGETLAFEDSLTGCISAAKAGIKLLCIWDQLTPKRKFPDEVVGYAGDFTPFPGQLDTTYYEDILQLAKEQENPKAEPII